MLERLFQLPDRKRCRALSRFTADFERPGRGIDTGQRRLAAVVTDEQVFRGRNAIVQQVCRRFRVDRPVIQHDEPFLARNLERLVGLREGRGNQATRHEVGKGNRRADRRRHCCEAAVLQKASACQGVAFAAPDEFISGDRIVVVEFVNSALFLSHGAPLKISD